jgi:hypothetical protein
LQTYQTSPCAECPWRKDIPPGQFSPLRFIALAHTAYDMAMAQFACHKSPPGLEFGCAGFVLRGATHSLGARLAASRGTLEPQRVSSPYPLYANYRAMAIANGVPPDDPALLGCRDDV